MAVTVYSIRHTGTWLVAKLLRRLILPATDIARWDKADKHHNILWRQFDLVDDPFVNEISGGQAGPVVVPVRDPILSLLSHIFRDYRSVANYEAKVPVQYRQQFVRNHISKYVRLLSVEGECFFFPWDIAQSSEERNIRLCSLACYLTDCGYSVYLSQMFKPDTWREVNSTVNFLTGGDLGINYNPLALASYRARTQPLPLESQLFREIKDDILAGSVDKFRYIFNPEFKLLTQAHELKRGLRNLGYTELVW